MSYLNENHHKHIAVHSSFQAQYHVYYGLFYLIRILQKSYVKLCVFVYSDDSLIRTCLSSRYFRINEFSGLLNRPSAQKTEIGSRTFCPD